MKTNKCKWYKNAMIYEIYLASFTTKGLQGVIEKLDYIKNLGVQAIWLCPIFMSPFIDSGYDTQDYYKINENFGSMCDMEELIIKAHDIGLRVILDIAVNHTSNEHGWFIDACKSKESKYRDYYIFEEGSKEEYPNNWISSKTHKPTWTYNEKTNDYYLHIYTKYQPDLNWRNIKVRNEIYNILKFWIQKGVDGFRLDVINKIAKPMLIRDSKSLNKYADYLYENHIDSHMFIKELREKVFDQYEGILMMGQTSGINVEQGILYGSSKNRELDLFLQFDHMELSNENIVKLQNSIMKWQNIDAQGAWPTIFMGSHDSSRMVNHFATSDIKYRDIAAKMLCSLQLCLKGTQIIYMGDELAISNVKKMHIDEFVDIRSKDIYSAKIKEGLHPEQIIEILNNTTRDNARRQIPWQKAYDMSNDKESVLTFYKNMISWRNRQEAILYGETISLHDNHENIFAYKRVYKDTEITLYANMSAKDIQLDLQTEGEEVISNYKKCDPNVLFPFQVKIYKKQVKNDL